MTKDCCFWCLKPFDKNETFDKEKDTMRFSTYTPCETCQELFSKGIHVIGVDEQPRIQGQPAMSKTQDGKELYPNGTMFLASKEWVEQFLDQPEDKEYLENVLKEKVMLLPSSLLDRIIESFNEEDKEDKNLIEDEEILESTNEVELSNNQMGDA